MAERRLDRGTFLRGGAAVTAGAVALAVWPRTTASAPSAKQDAEILRFALTVEDLQAAFYADALRRGALEGELLEFAQTVGDHERAHAEHIRHALGAGAPKPARFDFGDTNADPKRFGQTAIELEEIGLAAYNGAATSLTPDALADAARIVSVEARHVSWIRDIVGADPAPNAADKPISAGDAQAAVAKTGFVK
jgi:ferritin-like protein